MTRSTAVRAAVLGAGCSAALMIYAGRKSPQALVIALFVVWVVFPFIAMLAAAMWARRWTEPRQRALYRFITATSAISVVIYALAAFVPIGQRPTPIFVMLAPISLLSLLVTMVLAARMYRGRA